MPNGSRKARGRPAAVHFDAREVEEEIRQNQAANERFMREYSEWFGRNKAPKPAKPKGN